MKKESVPKKPDEIQEILRVYKLMEKEGLSELNMEKGDSILFIKRNAGGEAVPKREFPVQDTARRQHKQLPVIQQKQEAAPPAKEKKDDTVPIKSPMNGIFYRASSPDADPFVKEGDSVSSGQTVCIIEAMKSMNEIKADVNCRIVRILVSNAESVTSGQDLFLVLPGKK